MKKHLFKLGENGERKFSHVHIAKLIASYGYSYITSCVYYRHAKEIVETYYNCELIYDENRKIGFLLWLDDEGCVLRDYQVVGDE